MLEKTDENCSLCRYAVSKNYIRYAAEQGSLDSRNEMRPRKGFTTLFAKILEYPRIEVKLKTDAQSLLPPAPEKEFVNLMESASSLGCRRFVGTGTIIETNAGLSLTHHPNMVYAVTKDCVNKLLAHRARELGIRYCWCRLCGLYGGKDHTGNLVSYAISTLQQGIAPEFPSGTQPHSFIHVENCASALILVL